MKLNEFAKHSFTRCELGLERVLARGTKVIRRTVQEPATVPTTNGIIGVLITEDEREGLER